MAGVKDERSPNQHSNIVQNRTVHNQYGAGLGVKGGIRDTTRKTASIDRDEYRSEVVPKKDTPRDA
jgi:RNase P/RNase MRP subunit p29